MKPSLLEIDVLMAGLSRKYQILARLALSDILNGITDKTDIRAVGKLVKETFRKFNINEELRTAITNGLAPSIMAGAGVELGETEQIMLKKWYLKNAYSIAGSEFSPAIHNPMHIGEIERTIKQSFQANLSWRQTADELMKTNIRGNVAFDVSDLLSDSRRAFRLADNSEGYAEYRRDLTRVQSRINGLKDPSTSELKNAYQKVVDLTRTSSEAEWARAAKYAVYFKAKANAERVAQTEFTKAYKQGFISAVNHDEDAIGWRWVLAGDHENVDECDMYAEADLYGMGEGIFPQDVEPPFTHANCYCDCEIVYKGEAPENTIDDFDPEAGQEYIDGLDEEDQKSFLGVQGSRDFEDNPGSWRDIIDMEDHQTAQPTPESLLKE
jgi:hypothetical protein